MGFKVRIRHAHLHFHSGLPSRSPCKSKTLQKVKAQSAKAASGTNNWNSQDHSSQANRLPTSPPETSVPQDKTRDSTPKSPICSPKPMGPSLRRPLYDMSRRLWVLPGNGTWHAARQQIMIPYGNHPAAQQASSPFRY